MIQIRAIKQEEVTTARRLIYYVAHEVYKDTRTLDESMAFYDAKGVLEDMDDVQKSYFDDNGTFLVLIDKDRIVGTGAIKKIDAETCELKRLWFLREYRGKGLGHQMMQELLTFARSRGYRRVRLETDPVAQSQALNFYKRLGFYEIPRYSQNQDEIALELIL
ncbi:MAG: GNAT family N-acetyltransferase [Chloroflexi bacterium]|nr:GNAT family N-acetyltransferase [Chloroflexota bacterium]